MVKTLVFNLPIWFPSHRRTLGGISMFDDCNMFLVKRLKLLDGQNLLVPFQMSYQWPCFDHVFHVLSSTSLHFWISHNVLMSKCFEIGVLLNELSCHVLNINYAASLIHAWDLINYHGYMIIHSYWP